jgi:hypothetical protein
MLLNSTRSTPRIYAFVIHNLLPENPHKHWRWSRERSRGKQRTETKNGLYWVGKIDFWLNTLARHSAEMAQRLELRGEKNQPRKVGFFTSGGDGVNRTRVQKPLIEKSY